MSELLSENFPFLVVNFSIYLNRRVFVMIRPDQSPDQGSIWNSYFYPKTRLMGADWYCFFETMLMHTHKLYFGAEMSKIFVWSYMYVCAIV